MIRVVRAWFRETNTAIAATVGFVGGWALYQFLLSISSGILYPTLWDPFDDQDKRTSISFIDIYYPAIIVQGLALLMLAAFIYALFIWPGGEPTEEDPDTAECPECKSEIWADATRCAYCTSPVTPRSSALDAET